MLTEVALTPQVFDPENNPDTEPWLGCISELGHGFFPRGGAPPVMVANLQDGGWAGEVKNAVGRITDHRARVRVQQLASRLKEIVIDRPSVNYWPDGEEGWANEAVASHKFEPIGRIVLTDGFGESYQPSAGKCCTLKQTCQDTFWEGIQSSGPVPMNIGQQVALLRPVCAHAHYLVLKLPHVRGSRDDETPFAAALFESAFRRSARFQPVQAELHVSGEGLQGRALTNTVSNIHSSLAQALPRGSEVLLCLRPRFIDRKLVAGILTKSAGQVLRAPRWAISFDHVARPHDNRSDATWSLIAPQNLAALAKDLDMNATSLLDRRMLHF